MQAQTEHMNLSRSQSKTNLCKRLLFGLLSKLQHGHLIITDAEQKHCFGDSTHQLKAEIVVHDQAFYRRALLQGTVGAGESYMEGQWDSPSLTPLVQLLVRNMPLLDRIDHLISAPTQMARRLKNLLKINTKRGSKKNISAHYDLGNDFYSLFLDPTMAYSCAVFQQGDTLQQAQLRKFDAICQKLELKEGEHLVEIGTGWGGLALHAATHYGVEVTTTTISERQYDYAKQQIESLGMSDKINLLKSDYRDLEGQYDKLVSVEMLEAVGYRYLDTYMRKCESLLKPGGKMLLQSITISDQRFDRYRKQVDFIQRYVFPGGFLPSVNALSNCLARKTQLQIAGLDDIGLHYATTLAEWSKRLENARGALTELGKDESFYRLWQFYFHYCRGGFLERSISTVHLTADKPRHGH
ncbi:MAG: class I SAM-dependent methyltransferase [Granulosicoccaceae bacterium]